MFQHVPTVSCTTSIELEYIGIECAFFRIRTVGPAEQPSCWRNGDVPMFNQGTHVLGTPGALLVVGVLSPQTGPIDPRVVHGVEPAAS